MRALLLCALLVAGSACGHYGAPGRPEDSKRTAPVSAPPEQPAAADEECEEQAP